MCIVVIYVYSNFLTCKRQRSKILISGHHITSQDVEGDRFARHNNIFIHSTIKVISHTQCQRLKLGFLSDSERRIILNSFFRV